MDMQPCMDVHVLNFISTFLLDVSNTIIRTKLSLLFEGNDLLTNELAKQVTHLSV